MPGATQPVRFAALEKADESDRELVARVRAGDEHAFEALYLAYSDGLGAYVTGLIGSHEKAQDVVHDLFLHLWEHRHSIEIPHAFASYLFRAARNRALDHVRHERVTAEYRARVARSDASFENQVQPPPSAQAVVEAQDLERAVAAAIASLPPRCREVFLLNRRHRMTYAQVAQTLGISQKTVEVQMTRALRDLRLALESVLITAVAFIGSAMS